MVLSLTSQVQPLHAAVRAIETVAATGAGGGDEGRWLCGGSKAKGYSRYMYCRWLWAGKLGSVSRECWGMGVVGANVTYSRAAP